MFDKDASRLARIDWTKYGLSALNMATGAEPTVEQLQQAIVGMATGFRQFTEELAQVLGGHDIPAKHRAPVALIGYEPDAPGINDDTDIEDTYPRLMSWSGDSYYDPDDDYAKGGLAGLFQGVVVMRPNVNNVNVNVGNAQHKVVLWGQNGAGIRFDNIYADNIYDLNGNVWSAFPAGSVMLWAGSVGSIPSGWALMDGTANSVGNGGSGIDMRGLIPYGYSGSGAFATIGASVALTFTGAEINGNSTTPSVVNSNTTGITVSTPLLSHTAALGVTTIQTDFCIFGLDDTGDEFDGTNVDANYVNDESTPAKLTSQGHRHDITMSTITNGIADHAAGSSCTVTDSGHTHTVHIDNLAAALILDPPTTLRTPGVVLAYIEKLQSP